jgi:ribosomal protein S18 acetylase RimI-like enzyme
VTVRPYAPGDFAAACRVHDAARPLELLGSCDARAFRPLAGDTDDLPHFERATRWVACAPDGAVVGFAGIDGDALSWLYVDPAWHRRGAGRRLLAHALAHLPPACRTQTPARNRPALALYRSAGFVVVRTLATREAGYAMELALLERSAATALAAALDRDDWAAARPLLAPDCAYETGDRTLVGPDAILASYADSSAWARRAIERVEYESEVAAVSGDTTTVTYIDRLFHGGLAHVHRCRQHLTVDAAGRVGRIVHEDLAGEAEALAGFLARAGVRRDD